jgi:hypothetical protein
MTNAELQSELAKKDKLVKELKKEIEDLKNTIDDLKQGGNDDDDDDDLSDDDMGQVQGKIDDSWWSKYLKVRQFRILNGHCNVPGKEPEIGKWLLWQKFQFGKDKVSVEKQVLLDRLDIHWGKKYGDPKSWEENFGELKKFKDTMGHCNIYLDTKSPSTLAKWVQAQRAE